MSGVPRRCFAQAPTYARYLAISGGGLHKAKRGFSVSSLASQYSNLAQAQRPKDDTQHDAGEIYIQSRLRIVSAIRQSDIGHS